MIKVINHHSSHELLRYVSITTLASRLTKVALAFGLMVSGTSQAQQAVADGVYRFVAAHSQQSLVIPRLSSASGEQAVQATWPGNDSARWMIHSTGGGKYVLKAQHSGMVLGVAGCSLSNGAKVQQVPALGWSPCQYWRIEPMGDGTVRLLNGYSGKALEVLGTSYLENALVVQRGWIGSLNQRWRLEPVSPNSVPVGNYKFLSVFSKQSMEVAGFSLTAGSTVWQWAPWNGINQKWRIAPTPDGFFEIAPNHAPWMRLELSGLASLDGITVRQNLSNGSNAQRWSFTRQSDGNWSISNRDGTKVLDAGVAIANGSSIVQSNPKGTTAQRWELAPSPMSSDCAAKRATYGYDVVLLMGQSNMSGYGNGYNVAIDGQQDQRILQWSRNAGAVWASEPLQHVDYQPGQIRVGMGTSFARNYLATLPNNRGVLLVPTAQGSTHLYNGPWLPGGYLFEDASLRLQLALSSNPNNCVAAVLWHQGEADIVLNSPAAEYEYALKRVISELRARNPRSGTSPFIIGEMSPVWQSNPGFGISATQVKAIVEALKRVAASTPNTAFAPSTGITTTNPGDTIHFDAQAQRIYGRRYFESLNEAIERQ